MNTIGFRLRALFLNMFGRSKSIRLGIYGEPNTGKTTLANKICMDWVGEPMGRVSEIPHETRTIQKKEKVEVKIGRRKLNLNLLDMPGLATRVDYQEFMKFALSPTPETLNTEQLLKSLKTNELKIISGAKKLPATGKKATLVSRLDEALEKQELLELIDQLSLKPNLKAKKIKPTDARKRAKEATEGIIEAIKWLDKVDTVLVMLDSTRDPYTQVNLMLIGNLRMKKIPIVIVANKTDLPNSNISQIEEAFPEHPVVPISALMGDNLEALYSTIANQSK